MNNETKVFKTIMNKYKRHKKKANLLTFSRKQNLSLNAVFEREFGKLKPHQNFSDNEYIINEIKNENKRQKTYKVFETIDKKEYAFERNRILKNEKYTRESFFNNRNKSFLHKKNNTIQQNSLFNTESTFLTTSNSLFKRKIIPLPLIFNQTLTPAFRTNYNNCKAESIFANDKNLFKKRIKVFGINKKNRFGKTISKQKIKNFLFDTKTSLNSKNSTEGNISRDSKYAKTKDGNLFLKNLKANDFSSKALNFNSSKSSLNIRNIEKFSLYMMRTQQILSEISKVAQSSKNLEKNINNYQKETNFLYKQEENKFKNLNVDIGQTIT